MSVNSVRRISLSIAKFLGTETETDGDGVCLTDDVACIGV